MINYDCDERDVVKMKDLNSLNINQKKSISAIQDLQFESKSGEEKEKEQESLGVSISNFDSLMEHMTTMNIKFLN